MILVSPAERGPFKELGPSSPVTEDHGADFLIPSYRLVGVQRKEFPGDFLNSLGDRLSTSAMKLSHIDVPILVLEGKPQWSRDGALVGHQYGQGKSFTRQQLNALTFSLFAEFGIATWWTSSVADTIEFLRTLESWADKPRHDSLFNRGSPPKTVRGRVRQEDRAVWFLQGVPGIGPKTARDIYQAFGRVPMHLSVTDEEFLATKGVGPKTLEAVKEVLE